jgi:hypothetical protein
MNKKSQPVKPTMCRDQKEVWVTLLEEPAREPQFVTVQVDKPKSEPQFLQVPVTREKRKSYRVWAEVET